MLKELGKKYDRIAGKYAKAINENFWNRLLEYPQTSAEIRKLDIKGKLVLDVGCGSGRYAKLLAKMGAKVYGIDNSKALIKIAKREVAGVEFKTGDACNTKYKYGVFDAVISALVLEYLDRDKFFKEMNRILKRSGVLLFSMHIPYTELGEMTGKGNHVFKFKNYFEEGNFYRNWPSFKTRMPFRHDTMQTIMRAMLHNGFVIEDYIDVKPRVRAKNKYKREYERVISLPTLCIIKLRKVDR